MTPKKIKSNISFPDFFSKISKCKGEIYFSTEEIDRIDLRSTLSQLIFSTVIAGELKEIDGYIFCTKDCDYSLLKDYLEI